MEFATTYWLMPAAQDVDRLQSLVDDLARSYGAERFEPHITIFYHAGLTEVAPQSLLEQCFADANSFSAAPTSLEESEVFTKTFYLQFALTDHLQAPFQTLKTSCPVESDYVFNPHLSLLYASIAETERKKLIELHQDVIRPITFSEVRVVKTPVPVNRNEHVRQWETLASLQLGPVS